MASRQKESNYFIRTLNGMAYGFFASLIVGTILKQIGLFVHIDELVTWGTIATYLMGPAIGVGMAYTLDAKGLNIISAVIAGTIGAGTFDLSEGITVTTGNPISAYIAVIVAVELVRLVQDKTPIDILVVPLASIISAGLITMFVGPYVTMVINWFGDLINQGVSMQPILMGIVVSVLMGMALTAPISSAAIGIMLGLDGLAAGAALAGSCAQMVGFAVMSFDDNGIGNVVAIGIGTSMLQFKNIVLNPFVWLPPIIAGALSGVISTAFVGIECTAVGSGMGTAGLVGLIEAISIMGSAYWLPIVVVDVVLPMIISYVLYKGLRHLNYIHKGDLKLNRI